MVVNFLNQRPQRRTPRPCVTPRTAASSRTSTQPWSTMPSFVTLDELSARTPDGRTLFENLTLAFGAERTGLVGRNGVGKTTLLRIIGGDLAPAAGTVAVRVRLGVLRQALQPPPGATVADLLGLAEPLARLRRIAEGAGTARSSAV